MTSTTKRTLSILINGETHTRKTAHDYTHVAVNGYGAVSWHKSQALAVKHVSPAWSGTAYVYEVATGEKVQTVHPPISQPEAVAALANLGPKPRSGRKLAAWYSDRDHLTALTRYYTERA